MTQIRKAESDLALSESMLKEVQPKDFKKLLSAFIIRACGLHLQPLPDPDSLKGIVDELYTLLVTVWPGCKPEQLWNTILFGMAKQGQYNYRVSYSTIANWILYHRTEAMRAKPKLRNEITEPGNFNQRAGELLKGLEDYKRRRDESNNVPESR